VCIIVGGDGYSTPISKVRIPFDEQNRSAALDTSTTSAWRLRAQ
jgi:hypothetical protein